MPGGSLEGGRQRLPRGTIQDFASIAKILRTVPHFTPAVPLFLQTDPCWTPREPRMPSTEELVAAVRAGEKAAFGELVRHYERAAILTAHAILHDFHAAQDAAHESFVIAYEKLDQLRNTSAFGLWILQIVRRQALQLRRKPRLQELDTDKAEVPPGPSADWSHQYEEVIEQLAGLPEHERVVVILRYVDGHSVQEIADTTGKAPSTVTKQLSRAVRRLRTWLVKVRS